MEIVMNRLEKHAGFYRGYLTDDRSLVPLTIVLVTTVAVWLLVYIVGGAGPAPQMQMAARIPTSAVSQQPLDIHVAAKPQRP
jgi:hypothetical protein